MNNSLNNLINNTATHHHLTTLENTAITLCAVAIFYMCVLLLYNYYDLETDIRIIPQKPLLLECIEEKSERSSVRKNIGVLQRKQQT
jgi:hypothetical protein